MMIYAQIKDGVVSNTIVLVETDIIELFQEGFDSVVRIDQLDPVPGPRWVYDGNAFTPPPVPYTDAEYGDTDG